MGMVFWEFGESLRSISLPALHRRRHSSADIMEAEPLERPISDAMNAETRPSYAGSPRLDIAERLQAHDE